MKFLEYATPTQWDGIGSGLAVFLPYKKGSTSSPMPTANPLYPFFPGPLRHPPGDESSILGTGEWKVSYEFNPTFFEGLWGHTPTKKDAFQAGTNTRVLDLGSLPGLDDPPDEDEKVENDPGWESLQASVEHWRWRDEDTDGEPYFPNLDGERGGLRWSLRDLIPDPEFIILDWQSEINISVNIGGLVPVLRDGEPGWELPIYVSGGAVIYEVGPERDPDEVEYDPVTGEEIGGGGAWFYERDIYTTYHYKYDGKDYGKSPDGRLPTGQDENTFIISISKGQPLRY